MTISIPFTPPHVSVNRVKIIDLPGLPVDDEVRGQMAYHLLSVLAVTHYARERAEALQLPAAFFQDTTQTRLELPRFVDDCLSSPSESIRAAARAIGQRLGRNLGYILLTLHRGDAVNRAARLDWTAEDWEHWAKIERVWLGGGLMSGALGELIIRSARDCLAGYSYAGQLRVEHSPYGEMMVVLGAARYLPALTRAALCLDFGQTTVKRVCLEFEDGVMVRVHRFESLAREVDELPTTATPEPDIGRKVLDMMTGAIAQTLDETIACGITPGADLMLSVAAYVQGGQLLGNGLYASLNALADDARPLLADAVHVRTGRAMRVHLIHDGTAACALYAGVPNAAVIVVGTALGIGFPPVDELGWRPLAPNLMTRRGYGERDIR
jgi:hypothetical protein